MKPDVARAISDKTGQTRRLKLISKKKVTEVVVKRQEDVSDSSPGRSNTHCHLALR